MFVCVVSSVCVYCVLCIYVYMQCVFIHTIMHVYLHAYTYMYMSLCMCAQCIYVGFITYRYWPTVQASQLCCDYIIKATVTIQMQSSLTMRKGRDRDRPQS